MNHIQNWNESIIIFDTSALIDMYLYSEESKNDIFNNVFKGLKGQLWVPHKVMQEFEKHRLKKIFLPTVKYQELLNKKNDATDKGFFLEIEDHFNKIIGVTKTLKEDTSKTDRHPFFEANFLDEFEISLEQSKILFSKIKDITQKKCNQLESEIKQKLESNSDEVFNAINEYFDKGEEYDFNQVLEIVKEGDLRFRHKIPPGYEDDKKNKKDDISKFSDLIIWKQILEFARKKKKDVVLVINDTKPDWCHRVNGDSKKIEKPREELIFEINTVAGVNLFMYTTYQFLHDAKKILKSDISQKTLEEVKILPYEIEDKLFLLLSKWAEANYPVSTMDYEYIKSIEYDNKYYYNYKYAPTLYNFDLYLILNDNRKVGIEYRGMRLQKHNIENKLSKGKELIISKNIDEFCLLLFVNEDDENYLNLIHSFDFMVDSQVYIKIISK